MTSSEVLLLAFLIGVVAGLRSLTAPAVVAWAAHRNWLNLQTTPFSFMGSSAAVVAFVLLAVIELVADQLPNTPSRTKPPGLIARIILGGLSGAAVAAAGAQSIVTGGILGAAGRYCGRIWRVSGSHAPGPCAQSSGFRHCVFRRRSGHWRRPFHRFAILGCRRVSAYPVKLEVTARILCSKAHSPKFLARNMIARSKRSGPLSRRSAISNLSSRSSPTRN